MENKATKKTPSNYIDLMRNFLIPKVDIYRDFNKAIIGEEHQYSLYSGLITKIPTNISVKNYLLGITDEKEKKISCRDIKNPDIINKLLNKEIDWLEVLRITFNSTLNGFLAEESVKKYLNTYDRKYIEPTLEEDISKNIDLKIKEKEGEFYKNIQIKSITKNDSKSTIDIKSYLFKNVDFYFLVKPSIIEVRIPLNGTNILKYHFSTNWKTDYSHKAKVKYYKDYNRIINKIK